MKIILFTISLILNFSVCSNSKIENTLNSKNSYQKLLFKANQNNHEAQYELGLMYETGHFVNNIDAYSKKAFYWYQKSANAGNTTAQSKLGIMYAEGKGVVRNTIKAKYWMKKAYKNGDKETSAFTKWIYERQLKYGNIE